MLFTFTDPQGKEHSIEGPDGATRAQAFKMLQVREDLRQKRIEADQAKTKEGLDAELRQSAGPLEQYGAGVNNLIQGGKQLLSHVLPGITPETDQEIQDRRASNEDLSGGKWYNKGLQGAGEAITSLPLTMGAAGMVGRGATMIPALANTAKVGGRVANLGAVGNGIVQGATQAGLNSTTSDESPTIQALVGAGVGGALPLATGAIGGASRALSTRVGPTADRAIKYLKDTLGNPELDKITAATTSNSSSLPLSTAALSESQKLAMLERGARNSGRVDWAAVKDEPVASDVWDQLRNITQRGGSELDRTQLGAIENRFQSPRGATASDIREFGDVPEVTAAKLRGALKTHGEDKTGSLINEDARWGIENLKDELAKHELWKPTRSPGLTGVEDATILDKPGFGYGSPLKPSTMTKAGLKLLLGKARGLSTDVIDQALVNPADWQALMARRTGNMQPLTAAELLRKQLMLTPANLTIAGTGD